MSNDRLFDATLARNNRGNKPPVWFMRQAGRYHTHYQKIRSRYSFVDVCKIPEVACEATLGPIEDFGFDAAILFSDILFPLEALGMSLTFEPGPKFARQIETLSDIANLHGGAETAREKLCFQAKAISLIRQKLPKKTSLIGFVGAPLTLFHFAVLGSHRATAATLDSAFEDGRFTAFSNAIHDCLAEAMAQQARAGAGSVAVFDTCAGDVPHGVYQDIIVPQLARLLQLFKDRCPATPVIYYAKATGPQHWELLRDLPIDCLGIDWHHDLREVLDAFGDRWAIQGNVDPQWLCLSENELRPRLESWFSQLATIPQRKRRGWVCGLGHGILPTTPEANVRLFLRLRDEVFA